MQYINVLSFKRPELELAKEGHMQLQQLATFETLYMRKRQAIMPIPEVKS